MIGFSGRWPDLRMSFSNPVTEGEIEAPLRYAAQGLTSYSNHAATGFSLPPYPSGASTI
jgi:hypothetical protein